MIRSSSGATFLLTLLSFLIESKPLSAQQLLDSLPTTDWNHKTLPLRMADADWTVIALLSLDCPISNQSVATLTTLAQEFGRQNVQFLGLLPGDTPSEGLHKRVTEFQAGFPIRLDPKFQATNRLSGEKVPEVFLFNRQGKLSYRGRIDNAYDSRLKRKPSVTSQDLRDAILAVLAGQPVRQATTSVVGCPIFRPTPQPTVEAKVSFYKDVEPILVERCQSCHRPGQVGPFSLMTYKQAVTWADDIRTYTQNRAMPPWKPRGGPGYKNERSLSDAEIATLSQWVEAGCPEGTPPTTPRSLPSTEDEGWEFGPPDLVLTLQEPFTVGPSGADLFRCFVIPTGLMQDRYVTGIEVKPGNPRVVHHVLNFWDRTGQARKLELAEQGRAKKTAHDHGPGYNSGMGIGFLPVPSQDRPEIPPIGSLGGWAPGMRASKFPDGSGMLLPAKSDLVVQTHYHRTGRVESDQIRVGLYFAKKPIERRWQTLAVSGMSAVPGFLARFTSQGIPAGEKAFPLKGSRWLTTAADLHSVMAHMHLIGKSVRITMTTPDGQQTVLLDIPEWDYNWQESYYFAKPIAAPAGTRIDVEAIFDNSSSNPLNPSNPPKNVYFGEETTDEMLFGFIGATPRGSDRIRLSATPPKPVQVPAK
jgi:hypothetical protein